MMEKFTHEVIEDLTEENAVMRALLERFVKADSESQTWDEFGILAEGTFNETIDFLGSTF